MEMPMKKIFAKSPLDLDHGRIPRERGRYEEENKTASVKTWECPSATGVTAFSVVIRYSCHPRAVGFCIGLFLSVSPLPHRRALSTVSISPVLPVCLSVDLLARSTAPTSAKVQGARRTDEETGCDPECARKLETLSAIVGQLRRVKISSSADSERACKRTRTAGAPPTFHSRGSKSISFDQPSGGCGTDSIRR